MKKVKVIDSMMGTGKTSYAIQTMQEAPSSQRFIYVTPFLTEVSRVKEEVTNRRLREPKNKHGFGKKLDSLKRLLKKGADIVTTHALFAIVDEEVSELLMKNKYTLFLDEVMQVVSQIDCIRRDDIPILLGSDRINLDKDGKVNWLGDPALNSRYNEVKLYALAGNLYSLNDIALVWNFPAEIFKLFKQVYILTYFFKGQIQRYYFDLHSVPYRYYSVKKESNNYILVRLKDLDEDRSHLKEKIRIYDGKLNEIDKKDNSLSKSWFKDGNNGSKIKKLKSNLYNYFRNIQRAKADDILWTTFKGEFNKIKGKGYSKIKPDTIHNDKGNSCFVPFTIRATNQYKHKTKLAYCLNRYLNPIEKNFFSQHGVKIDEDSLALSDLLQWLFRSAIREGKTIDLYIPSKRMRNLLIDWLEMKR
jgi:hypothetical protein